MVLLFSQCPDKALALHPKKLYSLITKMPGLSMDYYLAKDQITYHFNRLDFDTTRLNKQLYAVIGAALIQYTHNILSTTAVAKYLLNTMFTYSNGVLKSQLPRTVLYLSHDSRMGGDYIVDLTLHGLKQLLGA